MKASKKFQEFVGEQAIRNANAYNKNRNNKTTQETDGTPIDKNKIGQNLERQKKKEERLNNVRDFLTEFGDNRPAKTTTNYRNSIEGYSPLTAEEAGKVRGERKKFIKESDIGNARLMLGDLEQSLAFSGGKDPFLKKRVEDYRTYVADLEKQYNAYDMTLKMHEFDDELTTRYNTKFGGEFMANYKQGDIVQESNKAWNAYFVNPTEENKKYAEFMEAVASTFKINNAGALSGKGLISQSLAGYLPQFFDQTVASGTGALVGGAVGLAAGNPVIGAKVGTVIGSGAYSYNNMRGAAFRELIKAGVDEETARAAASDEAVISSLIEMADTGIDIATLGIGSLYKAVGSKLVKKGAEEVAESSLKKFGKALLKYGINIGAEAGQEGLQEIISMTNLDRAMGEKINGYSVPSTGKWGLAEGTLNKAFDLSAEEKSQIKQSAVEGAKIAALMGGATIATTSAANYALNTKTGKQINEEGSLDDMVKLGLEQNANSEAYRRASAIQKKTEEGKTVSAAEIGKLYNANVQSLKKNFGGVKNAQDAEIASETTVESIQKSYGESGRKLFETSYNSEDNLIEFNKEFGKLYRAGLTNSSFEETDSKFGKILSPGVRRAAYDAGLNDAEASLKLQKEEAQFATIYGDDAGLVPNDVSESIDKETISLLNIMGKSAGARISMAEKVFEGKANGAYIDGEIVIAKDAENKFFVVTKHELTHHLQRVSPNEYRVYRDAAVRAMASKNGLTNSSIVEQYIRNAASAGVNLSQEQAMDEIAADFTEYILKDEKAFVEFASNTKRSVVQKFVDAVKNFLKKIKAVFKGDRGRQNQAALEEFNMTVAELEKIEGLWKDALKATQDKKGQVGQKNENEPRYSINENFVTEVDNWNKNGRPDGEIFILGSTGDTLQGLGAIESDIYIKSDKINLILEEHPEITLDIIKKIPRMIDDPTLVLKSAGKQRGKRGNTRLVIFGSVKVANGNPVLSVLDLRPVEGNFVVQDMQKVNSVYTKDNNPVQFVKNSEVLYADKKRTTPLLRTIGFQMPIELQHSGFAGNISYRGQNVNISGIPFDEIVKTSEPKFSLKAQKPLSETEYARFNKQVGDIKRGEVYNVSDDGLYIVPTGNKQGIENILVYTDGNYNDPSIDRVIKINSNNATEIDVVAEDIYEAEQTGNLRLIGLFEEKGIVSINEGANYRRDFLPGGRKNKLSEVDGTGRNEDRKGTSSDTGRQFSLKDSQGNKLTQEQAEYFKNSKIRDENGNLKVMYHGTMNDFTVFDTSVEGGKNGTAEGFGLYFADTQEVTKTYGDRQLMGYVNMTNPARSDRKTIKQNTLVKLVKALCEAEAKQMVEDGEHDSLKDALKDTWVSNYVYTYDMMMSQAYKEVAQTIIRTSGSDMEIVQEVMSGNAVRTYEQAYEFYEILKETTGIDGYITEWTGDTLPGGKAQIVIAFDSNQFKNIDNLKPTKSQDIRFSLKGQSNIVKENARLKQYNDLLREQMKLTKGINPDKKAMQKLTKAVLKDYQSNVAAAEIQSQFDELYNYLLKDDAIWSEAKNQALDIANEILRNATAVNTDLQQEFTDLKEYLRDYRISISDEAKGDFKGEYNQFRKRNFGWLTLTKDGENVDKVYQNLADVFPQYFDANITSEADQLMEIEKVYNQLKNVEYNPYSNEMETAAEYLANDIIDRFFDIPRAKPTFADKKKTQIDRIRQESRQRVKAAVKKERERNEKKLKEYKEAQKESKANMSDRRKRKTMRDKILRHIKPMQKKLLSPTDKQHVPEELRTSVAAVLSHIDTSSKRLNNKGGETVRTKAFQKAKKQLLEIAGETTLDPSLFGNSEEGIDSNFDAVLAMEDTKLDDMTLEQLETVWNVVKAMETAINNYGRFLSAFKYADTTAAANAFDQSFQTRKAKKGILTKYSLDLANAYTYFSQFGEPGMDFYRMLRNAQDYEQTLIGELAQRVSAIISKEQRKKFEKNLHTFKLESGDTLTLNTAHIMELYVAVRRDQFAGHLYKGGMVQPEINNKIRRGTDAVKVTEADTAKMFEVLSQEEKEIADAMQKVTLFLAEKGNEVSMKAYGYKKFTDPNYWTIRSAKEGLNQTIEKGQNQPRSIANMGSAKAVVPNASNPLEINGLFNTFDQHASDMITYSSWLLPMEDANRLFNFRFRDGEGVLTGRTMKGIINSISGEGGDKYWTNLMRDIQNGIGSPADDSWSGAVNKAINNVKKASVATNIRVVVQQPTAILRAMAAINPLDLVPVVNNLSATEGRGWKKALKYAPIAARKATGGFDVAMSPAQLAETLYSAKTVKGKAVEAIKEAPTWGAAKADEITWGTIWNACEQNIGRTRKDLKKGSEEFYEAVAEKFTDIIDQTQVVDGVLQRSQIMRSSRDLNRQATSFMGEPIMSLNLLLRSLDQIRYQTGKERSAGFKKLGRSAFALAAANTAVALAQSLVDAARDDETDEKYFIRVWRQFTGKPKDAEDWADVIAGVVLKGNLFDANNPVTWIPYIKDIHSMLQGYTVERMDAAAFADLVTATENAIKSLSGEGKWTREYAIMKTGLTASKLFGSSVSNLERDLVGVYRSILVQKNDYTGLYDLESKIYDVNNQRSHFIDLAYKALKDGDEEGYSYIVANMIDYGVEATKIQDAIKRKAKADKDFGENLVGFDATNAAAGIKFTQSETEKEDDEADFDLDNLTGEEYVDYLDYIGDNYQPVYNQLKDEGLYEFEAEDQEYIESRAYNYIASKALRQVAGNRYKEEREWVIRADEAVAAGISPARYFLVQKKFNTTDAKVNGNTVRGLKKTRMIAYLNSIPGLTRSEYNYFMKEVFGYK